MPGLQHQVGHGHSAASTDAIYCDRRW